jgi:hypothetical protein
MTTTTSIELRFRFACPWQSQTAVRAEATGGRENNGEEKRYIQECGAHVEAA